MKELVKGIIPTCFQIKINQSSHQAVVSDLRIQVILFSLGLFCPIVYAPVPLILLFFYKEKFSDFDYYHTLKNYFLTCFESDFNNDLDNTLPYEGCMETVVIKQFIKPENKIFLESDKKFQTIICNRKIRDILLKDWIIGVVGKKKCGKSAFIEKMIPNADAKASATIGTTVMSPHSIIESVVVIDYPHFDSLDFNHKLQFIFSKQLLDHTFMVCIAMEIMDSDNTQELFNYVKSNGDDRLTIFLNKADEIWGDEKNEKKSNDERKLSLEKLKEDVCVLRGFKSEEEKDMVILTCLKEIKDLKELDSIQTTNILMGDKLKVKVYETILKYIPDKEENKSKRSQFLEKIPVSDKQKSHKKISIQRGNTVALFKITKNKSLCEEETVYQSNNSFDDLVDELKTGRIQNPIIRLNSNHGIIMVIFISSFD